jgi:hypothetical protein
LETLKPTPARLAQLDVCGMAVLFDDAETNDCHLIIDEGDDDDDEYMET